MDRVREWAALIGRRNIAYVVFVSLLGSFGMLMEAAGPQGRDAGGGIMAAIMLWSVVSLIFFIANAGLAIKRYRQRPVGNEAVDCVRLADPVYCPPPATSQDLRSVRVPERAHRALDALSELRPIFEVLYALAR